MNNYYLGLIIFITSVVLYTSPFINYDNVTLFPYSASLSKTPLMNASEAGNNTLVQKLIDAGEDVNARVGCDQPHIGWCALGYAIRAQSLACVNALIKGGARVNEYVDWGGLVPDSTISTSSVSNNVRNHTLLALAINERCSLEIIKALIIAGADVNKTDFWVELWTPLIIATHTRSINVIKELLQAGADVCFKNKDGKTAYDYAQQLQFSEAVDLLCVK